ncbi:MAG: hypothetical protein GKR93_11745 [Gammaproteobacteria bacterium]|nr:hypothetical protein [Gammaproteobacteria bacterium]
MRRILLMGLALYMLPCSLIAKESGEDTRAVSTGLSQLFQEDQPLMMRLEAPFKKVFKKRDKDRPYFPASLTYKDSGGNDVRVEFELRVRGNFRAKKENCRFPPLKLNFKKKSLKGTIFDGENELKLVTHCKSASKYEQYVLLENMAYQLHNQYTDFSLRQRLATVEYVESGKEKPIATKVGFFIEDKKRMAARNGAKLLKKKRIEKTEYKQEHLHLATVFEYLLGNTDYSVILGPKGENCCHNIIPLQASDGMLVPVPYDFDVSGFVNPPYTSPPEHLGLRSLRQRLYRGYCQNTEGFKNSFAVFLEQKDAVYALLNASGAMKDKTRQSASRYLDQFYEAITEDKKINSEFIEKCRS